MKIIITGATGFIGSFLVTKLKEKKINFVVLCRKKNIEKVKGCKKIIIKKNLIKTQKEIHSFNPDVAIHLATNFKSQHNLKNLSKLINDNINFGAQFLEMLNHVNLKLFVNANTFSTSVDGKGYKPKNFYSATKKSFEDILKYYSDINKFKVINLSLCDTYGPQDKRKKFINLLLNAASNNKILYATPGNQEINYTFVEDVVDALILIVKNKKNFKKWSNYSLFSKEKFTLKKLKKKMEKILKKKINVKFGYYPYDKREIFKFYPRYKKIPGWSEKFNLKSGINKIIYFNNKNKKKYGSI